MSQLHIRFNRGLASQIDVYEDTGPFLVEAAQVRHREGTQIPLFDCTLLDRQGRWRDIDFGSRVDVRIDGMVVFTGNVTTVRFDTKGAHVYLEVEASGRRSVLYTKTVAADATYTAQTTGAIAKDVIDDHFTGTLTTAAVATATGVTVPAFSIAAGDNVGAVLERLVGNGWVHVRRGRKR
jgi:prophage tail gpP-like protein